MEQVEPIETTEGALLATKDALERLVPPIPEPRWSPGKAAKRKVRVLKVPHGEDPMEEKTIFEFGGFVYICYAVKTRGRYMIRCLGLAEAEHDRRIMDPGPAAKGLKDAIDDDVMKELDVEGPREKEQTPFEAGKLLDEAARELSDDAMGDAIKEAIDDEVVQQVIKEVAGDGGNRGPDETPNP